MVDSSAIPPPPPGFRMVDSSAPEPAAPSIPKAAGDLLMTLPGVAQGAGLFREFYNEGISPLLQTAWDSWKRGDLGERAIQQLVDTFKDHAAIMQQHPDIRNFPLIGPGATAVSNHAQDLWNKGDYGGAFGAMAGFLSQFFAPEALDAALAKLPEAQRAAAIAADRTGSLAKATAGAASDTVRGGFETVSAAVDPATVRAAIKIIPKGSNILDAWDTFQAARNAMRDARTPAAPPAVVRESPAWADIQPSPVTTPEFTPAAAPALPSGRVPGSLARAEAAAGAELTVTPAERAAGDVIDVRPEARTPEQMGAHPAAAGPATAEPESDLEAQLRASVEQARAKHAAAQQLEDHIDEHHAYLAGQAQDILWANRARKADRFAQFLIENNLAATPANIDLAARHLAEKRGPSAEIVPMIQDRVDWFNGSRANAATN
jgi:hypothetical protein